MNTQNEFLIFIIEDDFVFTNILTEYIDTIRSSNEFKNIKLNYQTFYSATEAFHELKLNPDIVLLDYHIMDDNLKPMTAIEFLEKTEKIGHNIDIVVVSGIEDKIKINELLDKGIKDFVSKKPESLKRLESVLSKIIHQRIKDKKSL